MSKMGVPSIKSAPNTCSTGPSFLSIAISRSCTEDKPMGLGRKGERVANTPMRVLPPRRGGRTVGDQPHRCGKLPQQPNVGIPLQAAQGVGIAVVRLKYDGGRQSVNQTALAGNAEFRGEIAVNVGDDSHLNRLQHCFTSNFIDIFQYKRRVGGGQARVRIEPQARSNGTNKEFPHGKGTLFVEKARKMCYVEIKEHKKKERMM